MGLSPILPATALALWWSCHSVRALPSMTVDLRSLEEQVGVQPDLFADKQTSKIPGHGRSLTLLFDTNNNANNIDVNSDPSVYPKYNPLKDAKCFNDRYDVPQMNSAVRNELYNDYVKIFEWGLQNPSNSPIFDTSSGVTSNRFPGMCLRMAFHDNTIIPSASTLSAQQYVASNINGGKWTGPAMWMATSGGDASSLICPTERLHPNNDYDQTASRVLHAFQSAESYPRGPGIQKSDGSRVNLIQKHGMSYSDALQNCALAAMTYLTEQRSLSRSFTSDTEFPQSDGVDRMVFGRLDACYISDRSRVLSDSVHRFNNRIALCGNSSVLPGVGLDALQVDEWFVSRGMAVGAWAALFGTHTLLDNFEDIKTLRNVGVKDFDYFEDFVGCPVMKRSGQYKGPEGIISDSESSSCAWHPQCSSGKARGRNSWPMVRSDCATGEFHQAAEQFFRFLPKSVSDLFNQTVKYVNGVGSWVPDCVCGLTHLGGPDSEDCVGPNAVNSARSNSLFGSVFDQKPYPGPEPSPYQSKPGDTLYVGHNSLSLAVGSDGTLLSSDQQKRTWASTHDEGWQDLPELSLNLAVVAANKYYRVGEDGRIYQWEGSRWNDISDLSTRKARIVAASWDDTVACVTDKGHIYYRARKLLLLNWWRTGFVSGVKDIALVGGGIMYYVLSNGDVYRTNDYDREGVKVGHDVVKIAAARDGTIVVLNTAGQLWQKTQDDFANQWFQIRPDIIPDDVAVQDSKNLFVSGKIGSESISFIYHVYLGQKQSEPTPTPSDSPSSSAPTAIPSQILLSGESIDPSVEVTKVQIASNAGFVSAGRDGTLAYTNPETNSLYKSIDQGSQWTYVQNLVSGVAVVANDRYYVLGTDSKVYRLAFSVSNELLSNSKGIAASKGGGAASIDKTSGKVYFKSGFNVQINWVEVQGLADVKDVALVDDNTLYYITSNGDVWRTTDYSQVGEKVLGDKNCEIVAAGKDGTVVVATSDGSLWQRVAGSITESWVKLVGATAVDVAVVDKDRIYITDQEYNIHSLSFQNTATVN